MQNFVWILSIIFAINTSAPYAATCFYAENKLDAEEQQGEVCKSGNDFYCDTPNGPKHSCSMATCTSTENITKICD